MMPLFQASALQKVKNILFKEIFFEKYFKKNIIYSKTEIFFFKQAGINPYDKNFFWPTRRLFILGLSKHSG